MMKAIGPAVYLIKNLALAGVEKKLSSRLWSDAHRVTCPSELDALFRRCAVSLSIDVLPELFITESGPPNAFTFGSEEHAFVVVDSTILRLLTTRELTALLGHELGHVKSGHMPYHTLAEILGRGISVSGSFLGLDLVSIPVRLALLAWHRQSEVTADRASLLVVDDISVMKSLMTKLAVWSSRGSVSSDQFNIDRDRADMLESASELFHTHPLHANRFRHAKQFYESDEFLTARRKIETRLDLLRALIPVCRFCEARKPIEDPFCPTCGRSQI